MASAGVEVGDRASFGPGCGPVAHVHFAAVVLPGAEPYMQLVPLHHPGLHNVSGHLVYMCLALSADDMTGASFSCFCADTSWSIRCQCRCQSAKNKWAWASLLPEAQHQPLECLATSNHHVVCHWPPGATYALAIVLRKMGVVDKLSFQSDLKVWVHTNPSTPLPGRFLPALPTFHPQFTPAFLPIKLPLVSCLKKKTKKQKSNNLGQWAWQDDFCVKINNF